MSASPPDGRRTSSTARLKGTRSVMSGRKLASGGIISEESGPHYRDRVEAAVGRQTESRSSARVRLHACRIRPQCSRTTAHPHVEPLLSLWAAACSGHPALRSQRPSSRPIAMRAQPVKRPTVRCGVSESSMPNDAHGRDFLRRAWRKNTPNQPNREAAFCPEGQKADALMRRFGGLRSSALATSGCKATLEGEMNSHRVRLEIRPRRDPSSRRPDPGAGWPA